MDNVLFRKLELKDCKGIDNMNPSQYIGRAWREVDGKRRLVNINFQDNGWPNGYGHHYNSLRNTILNNGIGIGAYDSNDKLLGFGSVNREFFGTRYKYVLLDQLFISLEHRNKGLGKKIFMLLVNAAKEWDADRIYICAGSAEETINFYYAIGCKEAEEINTKLYESDPRDFQLEFIL